eukprot:scaffold3836_cov87-Skeletonema_dohrnii-CCMP3373.AAC.1
MVHHCGAVAVLFTIIGTRTESSLPLLLSTCRKNSKLIVGVPGGRAFSCYWYLLRGRWGGFSALSPTLYEL